MSLRIKLLTPTLSHECFDSCFIEGRSFGFFFRHNFMKFTHSYDTFIEEL